MRTKPGYLVIALCFALGIVVFAPAWFDVAAQGDPPQDCPPTYEVPCRTPDALSEGAKSSWPQGAQVKVNIDPSFSDPHKAAIKKAFQNWQAGSTSSGNGLGVTFTFTENANPPPSPPPAGTYAAQFWNANPPGANSGKAGYSEVVNNGSHAVHATFWLNTQTTDPCAAAQTAAHEIGHSFGLDECPNCGYASSTMVEGDNGYNSANGTYGPTRCDNDKVKAVQQASACNDAGGYINEAGECKTLITPSSSPENGGGWNPDYGCTNYFWVEDWYYWNEQTETYEYDHSTVVGSAGCW